MLPRRPSASIRAASRHTPHRLVPVDPPAQVPVRSRRNRAAAMLAASGTRIIRSTTPGTKLGSTRGRPMPSIRDDTPVVWSAAPVAHPVRNAEFSGSTTASRVPCRR